MLNRYTVAISAVQNYSYHIPFNNKMTPFLWMDHAKEENSGPQEARFKYPVHSRLKYHMFKTFKTQDTDQCPCGTSLFVWSFGFSTSSSATKLSCRQVLRPTSDIFMCCHNKSERGDHQFCLRRSHYTDTDPTTMEQAPVRIKPLTSWPGVARSTD